jgi:integrase
MKKTLTNTAVIAAQPGAVFWDTVVPGLHLRAMVKAKAYYLFYRTKSGVSRKPKLGDAGIITLQQAREIAREHLAEVASGGDPMAARSKSRGEPTVSVFFERCYTDHWKRTKDHLNIRRLFDAHVAPRIGGQRVRAVCYDDIHRLHSAMHATPYQANRTLAIVSKMLNLAERFGERDIGSNPCRHIPRYPELSRRRFATPVELAAIGQAMDAAFKRQPKSVTFIALMIFTGMRPSEVAAARREWIVPVDQGGILRIADGKTGQRDVYLPPQALGLLTKLGDTKDGTLTGIQYPRKTWEAMREAIGAPDLRLYDLRRTFATVSLAGGQSISLIGEVLGHKTVQTTKVYARLMDGAARDLVAATGNSMAKMLAHRP